MVYDRNGSYVWRVIDGPDGAKTAEKVPVVVGLRKLGRVEITAGIQSGDAVVSAGTNKVMAGKRIVVVDAGGTVEGTAHAAEGAQRAPVAAASQSES